MESKGNNRSVADVLDASVPVSLVGSFPGTDVWETTAVVGGELPQLPLISELPGRGPGADMIGRTMSLLSLVSSDFSVITTPAGWRLASQHTANRPATMRRASAWLGEDLDATESSFSQYEGAFKLQLAGPWTLAACVELARGDKILRDSGAVAELQAALAAAVALHVADVGRRLPAASLLVQFDEPMLDAVLEGSIATPSGFSAYSPVPTLQASDALAVLAAACRAAGVIPGIHTCSDRSDIGLLAGAGAEFISCDLTRFGNLKAAQREARESAIGEFWDSGRSLFAGLPVEPGGVAAGSASFNTVDQLLHRLGVPIEEIHRQLVLTPACGLVGAGSLANVRDVISQLRTASTMLRDERLDDVVIDR